MRKAFILILLITLASSASGQSLQLKEIASGLMCPCSCEAMILETCICGQGLTLKTDIQAKLNSGQTKDQIYAQLVSQYSKKILAAPTKKGFDMVAWILPFAGAILMGVFAVYSIRSRLRKEEKAAANVGIIEEPKLQKYIDKIERELKEYK